MPGTATVPVATVRDKITAYNAIRRYGRPIMSKPQTTSKLLPREDLDLHVALRIRECIDAVLVLYQNDDDGIEATLKEGGETVLWTTVQEAIADAGWQVAPRPK
jgi:hypothetical protein